MRLSDKINEIKKDEKLSRKCEKINLTLSTITGITAVIGLFLEYFGENTFFENLGFFGNGLMSGYLYVSSKSWKYYGNHLRQNYPAYFDNDEYN